MNNLVKQIQITRVGLESLEKELEKLMNAKRPKLVERLANARAQGDLSENSDYQNARDELEFLDGRIAELDGVIKHAVVAGQAKGNKEVVFGAKVKVKASGKELLYEIVGEWDSDPIEKRISHNSPLGQALLGKKVGDKVKVEAPAGNITYEILNIR
jgi:transcription elongation factor GreA